ncbi:MAG: hypothetical protein ABI855_02700 [Bacteroidota bacterium]
MNFCVADVTFEDGNRNRGDSDIDWTFKTADSTFSLDKCLYRKDNNQTRNDYRRLLNIDYIF